MDLDAPSGDRPLPFSIDLNETPSPSSDTPTPPPSSADAYFLARWFHAMPAQALGPPAASPGEAGLAPALPCGACGKPETAGATLVCDSCDRGFHLGCARVRVRQLAVAGDWLCGDCVLGGIRSTRWELGKVLSAPGRMLPPPPRFGKRMLDMNSLPPSDGDAEPSAVEEDPPCRANGSRHLRHPDHMENGVHVHDSGTSKRLKISQGLYRKGLSSLRDLEGGILASSLGAMPLANNLILKAPPDLEQDIFRHSMKDFVSKKQGFLGDDWRVEYRQTSRYDFSTMYCPPDRRRVDSMYGVSNNLQMDPSTCFSTIDGKGEMPGSVHRGLPRRRRRKELARLVGSNNQAAYQEIEKNGCGGEVTETDHEHFCSNSDSRVAGSIDDDISLTDAQANVQLPVQFEDFFISSLGRIDGRPSYHNHRQIWPVGYESCWHDTVTGSIFKCHVSDGGDSGPLFCVKRYPCSSLSIPIGETILAPVVHNKVDLAEPLDNAMLSDFLDTEEDELLLLLSDPCAVVDQELLSYLSNRSDGTYDSENCTGSLNRDSVVGDEMGEFSVEGKSTSAVWWMVSQSFVSACRDAFQKFRRLYFRCKHVVSQHFLDCCSSLTKFSCATASPDLPRSITNESDLEYFCQSIAHWLNQDRFGLDMDFVQEFIEKLPGGQACGKYECLSDRSNYSTSQTVGSGMLCVKYRTVEPGEEKPASFHPDGETDKKDLPDECEEPSSFDNLPSCGRPLQSRIPSELVGDVLQIWDFFGRFHQNLGLEEPLSLEKLEEELIDPWSYSPICSGGEILDTRDTNSYHGTDAARSPSFISATESDPAVLPEATFIQVETEPMKETAHAKLQSLSNGKCTGVVLTTAHVSLLKVLVSELQCRVAVFADPNYDAGEVKPRRGRRKESESTVSTRKSKINMLPLNELTWPELARRYALAVSAMDFNQDSGEVCSREGTKVYRCLQGDGGILCGSVAGVAGMEADAQLLAEAGRQIYVSVKHENAQAMEFKEAESVNDSDSASLPEWAHVLEPVRKLPTNVGTRIRKCVYESLEKNPPEWARKILEHSISKEVYKGNASGPTKKAVLSVLEKVSGESFLRKPKERKEKHRESLLKLVMKLCRVVFRRSMAADDAKVFCNLLGTTLLNSSENDDEGVLGSPGQIPRPLDFRTIDLRLAYGAYGEHYDAFLEDVSELWHNIRTVYRDRPDLMELAESFSQNFELQYKSEVLNLIQDLSEEMGSVELSPELQKKIDNLLSVVNEMPKAPWEDGVCKVCGIDKDDDSVLLCDTCDSEYHTYCLDPPLSRIPAGNWYCPSCISSQSNTRAQISSTETEGYRGKECMHESKDVRKSLRLLAVSLENKEYWDLSLEERIFLLKFLCDEALNSIVIREKIDRSMDVYSDLQMKLRTLAAEWRDLRLKETTLVSRKETVRLVNGFGCDVKGQHAASICGNEGVQQSSSVPQQPCIASLGSQENGLFHSMDKDMDHGVLRGVNQKFFNGSLSQLCNFHASEQSKSYIVEKPSNCDSHSDNNVPGHDTLLFTLDSSKAEPCQLNNSLSNVVKRHKSECFHNPPESMETMDMEKHEHIVTCRKHLDEPSQLSDSGIVHSDGIRLGMPSVDSAPCSHETSSQPDNGIVPHDIINVQPTNEELDMLKREISQLLETIANIESKIFMSSLRRDLIGRDSFGRIFWSMGKPGRRPWLLVDGTIRVPHEKDSKQISSLDFTLNRPGNMYPKLSYDSQYATSTYDDKSSWMIYDSDKDINELISFLGNCDNKERELKDSVIQWQRLRSSQTWNTISDDFQMVSKSQITLQDIPVPCLLSKAFLLLEKNYGPCLELEADDIPRKLSKKAKRIKGDMLFRCECLEPVWPARHHCLLCHQTFSSSEELNCHNGGKCSLYEESRGTGKKIDIVHEKQYSSRASVSEVSKYGDSDSNSRPAKVPNRACPYNLEEICKKFITKNSNKELVKEIGLLGSNGFPILLESPPSHCSDSFLLVNLGNKHDTMTEGGLTSSCNVHSVSSKEPSQVFGDRVVSGIKCFANSSINPVDNMDMELATEQACIMEGTNTKDHTHLNKFPRPDGNNTCSIPESSMRPLSGRVAIILKKLKMNLLDMDAALPAEALRPSVIRSTKRCVWRAFVKSVKSIYELVQASVLFEAMIKSEYLKNERWYWSSVTAAVRTPTISSLALRIYSLDASIIYNKISDVEPISADNLRSSNRVGKRRKDMDGGT